MNDTPESRRWSRIEAILDQALELGASERAAFVAEQCAGDVELCAEVEELLRAAESPGPLDQSLGSLAGNVTEEAASGAAGEGSIVGRRVGPWRILEVIGAGGMGRVFLAERAEGGFEQRVALKLLRWEMASPSLVDRFRTEQQILASLEHPSIARLIDGGLTEEGLPYLAMEFVEGEPIDRASERGKADVPQRLGLFNQVAQAVEYAHRNLVVHRDLKPSNILVDREGRVRLLDFGVARILDEGGPTTQLTRTQLAPATPSWAAPEQLTGGSITTATDVWALGLLLYQLLTEEHPFELGGTPHDITERILKMDPLPPSKRVGGEQRGRLEGDLDNIVVKALSKDPERRYHSVERMVDDIERHLGGLPVSAHAPTWRYRAKKSLIRHRRALSVTAAVAIAIAGLTGFYTWRLIEERDRALSEKQKTEQVTLFVESLFEINAPLESRGEEVTAREMLDRGAERIETELAGQPGIAGDMHQVVGRLYSMLGAYPAAQVHLGRAAELRGEALGPGAVPVAESLDQLANSMQEQDDLDGAIEVLRDALAIRRAHPDDGLGLSHTLNELGLTLAYRGDYDEAEALLREAFELRKQVDGEFNAPAATVLSNLGLAIKWKGDFDRAEPIYRRVLEIRRVDPGELSPDYAISLDNLGVLLGQRGDYEESEQCFREALRIRMQLLGEEHPDVAMNLNNLATLYRVQGRLDEAEPIYREILDLNRRIHGPRHRTVATNLHNLGSILVSRGDYVAAVACLSEALEIRREVFGPDHIEVAMAQDNLVKALIELGELERADALSKEAEELARAAVGEESIQLASILTNRGRLLLERGWPGQAKPMLEESLRIRKQALAPDHWETGATSALLGECLAQLGDPGGETLMIEGYQTLLEGRGPEFGATERARAALHEYYQQSGNPQRASEYEHAVQGDTAEPNAADVHDETTSENASEAENPPKGEDP